MTSSVVLSYHWIDGVDLLICLLLHTTCDIGLYIMINRGINWKLYDTIAYATYNVKIINFINFYLQYSDFSAILYFIFKDFNMDKN